MAISGIGSGISELTVLAGVVELVRKSERGKFLALISTSLIPYLPSVMYAQLISHKSSWRYIGAIGGGSAVVALLATYCFYKPRLRDEEVPQHVPKARGTWNTFKKLDWAGIFLLFSGLALFEYALLGGGYEVSER